MSPDNILDRLASEEHCTEQLVETIRNSFIGDENRATRSNRSTKAKGNSFDKAFAKRIVHLIQTLLNESGTNKSPLTQSHQTLLVRIGLVAIHAKLLEDDSMDIYRVWYNFVCRLFDLKQLNEALIETKELVEMLADQENENSETSPDTFICSISSKIPMSRLEMIILCQIQAIRCIQQVLPNTSILTLVRNCMKLCVQLSKQSLANNSKKYIGFLWKLAFNSSNVISNKNDKINHRLEALSLLVQSDQYSEKVLVESYVKTSLFLEKCFGDTQKYYDALKNMDENLRKLVVNEPKLLIPWIECILAGAISAGYTADASNYINSLTEQGDANSKLTATYYKMALDLQQDALKSFDLQTFLSLQVDQGRPIDGLLRSVIYFRKFLSNYASLHFKKFPLYCLDKQNYDSLNASIFRTIITRTIEILKNILLAEYIAFYFRIAFNFEHESEPEFTIQLLKSIMKMNLDGPNLLPFLSYGYNIGGGYFANGRYGSCSSILEIICGALLERSIRIENAVKWFEILACSFACCENFEMAFETVRQYIVYTDSSFSLQAVESILIRIFRSCIKAKTDVDMKKLADYPVSFLYPFIKVIIKTGQRQLICDAWEVLSNLMISAQDFNFKLEIIKLGWMCGHSDECQANVKHLLKDNEKVDCSLHIWCAIIHASNPSEFVRFSEEVFSSFSHEESWKNFKNAEEIASDLILLADLHSCRRRFLIEARLWDLLYLFLLAVKNGITANFWYIMNPSLAKCFASRAYLDHGNYEMAGIAIYEAEKYMSVDESLPKETDLIFHMTYATYLSAIGNSDKCENILNDVAAENASNNDIYMLERAYCTRSTFSLQNGMLGASLSEALHWFQLLRQIGSSICGLSFDSLSTDKISIRQSTPPLKSSYTRWSLIKKFLDGCIHIGELYKRCGHCREAAFYFRQGSAFAEKTELHAYVCVFKNLLADLNYRKEALCDSKTLLNEVEVKLDQLEQDVKIRIDLLKDIELAEVCSRSGNTILAFENLSEAEKKLAAALLEEKKHFAAGKRQRKPKNSIFDGNALLSSLEKVCALRKAHLLTEQGRTEEANELIKRGNIVLQFSQEQVEHHHYKALNVFQDLFSERIDKVTIFPPLILRAVQAKAKKSKIQSESLIEKLHESAELSFFCSWPYYLYEACQIIASIHHLDRYNIDENEAKRMVMFQEIGKCLTAKREILAACQDKLIHSKQNHKWPTGSYSLSDDLSEKELKLKEIYDDYCQELQLTPAEFHEKYIQIIPKNWVVLSLNISSDKRDLMISRFESDCEFVSINLPFDRLDESFTLQTASCRLNEIITRHDEIIHDKSPCLTKEDKMRWWTERKKLDASLKCLLNEIEEKWLYGFEFLFRQSLGDVHDDICTLKTKLDALLKMMVKKITKKKVAAFNVRKICCHLLLLLGQKFEEKHVREIVKVIVNDLENQLSLSFTKAAFDELYTSISTLLVDFYDGNTHDGNQEKHIFLILDKRLHRFPWESLSMLRDKSVSRIPALSFLRDQLRKHESTTKEFVVRDAFYVLNPSGDLSETEKRLKPSLSEWAGVTQAPSEEKIREVLESKDVYMYFGHSGGEKYIRSSNLRKFDIRSVVLLIGCSSGHFLPNGEFDDWGVCLDYLIGGCPAIVANLWDVTDKDIDSFSLEFMSSWGICKKNGSTCSDTLSLPQAIAQARKVCKLNYLTGAAPTLFGLPITRVTRE